MSLSSTAIKPGAQGYFDYCSASRADQDPIALACQYAREDLAFCTSLPEKERIVEEFLNTLGCDIDLPIDPKENITFLDWARINKDSEFAGPLVLKYGANPDRCNHETVQFWSEIEAIAVARNAYENFLSETQKALSVIKKSIDIDSRSQSKLNLLVTEFAKYLLLEPEERRTQLIKKEWVSWCHKFNLDDQTSEHSMAVVGIGGRLTSASLRQGQMESNVDYQYRSKMCNVYKLMAQTIGPKLTPQNSKELLKWMQIMSGDLVLDEPIKNKKS